MLAVNASLPVRSLKELIALARERPGTLNFASSGLGSSTHMAGELFKQMTGVNIVHVPYKGNAPAISDALGGQVELVFSGVPALLPHLQNGRLRAIAIGSLRRFPAIPEVPTFDELGLKGYEATTWFGLLAPAGTPGDIISRLSAAARKVVASEEMKQRMLGQGLEPVGNPPEQFARLIKQEVPKWAKVVKASGAKVD